MTQSSTAPQVVDWSAAAQIAGRLAPPGPQAPREELDALVSGLRGAAADAVGHVLETTRMTPAPRGEGGSAALSPVAVVDRATWARANTQSMAVMTDGVGAVVAEISKGATSPGAQMAGAAEIGTALALLSGRVLGQFDPYSGPGRLLLVAPNVLQAERALRVPARDFRLWVCLHEQTHALQFGAAPWLAGHLSGSMRHLVTGMARTSAELAKARFDKKVITIGRSVLATLRGENGTLIDGMLTHEQKDELADITAVMALLEGHADVMMDAVGPRVVPSVRRIRARFERRRDGEGRSSFDVVVQKLLGMDAKLAQYRNGAAFVRAVERAVGRDGLNAVWAAPENLPSAREIADARAWVRRVHG
ncbi:zinc-dependent metalloprotease [Promicromonospora sp. NPDC057138]|uniref:zinc-dependent metalloprotease n=1 Tax=Promicromonospora sp. NPDC057138 TaxID=3346031 RepID=UPI003630FCF0